MRLGEIARIEKGQIAIQKAKPGKFPLVVTAAERATCDSFQFDGDAAIVPLISSTGHGHASLKRLHFQRGKFALGNILCAILPLTPEYVSARYIFEYLNAYKDELLVSRMSGTANVSLTIGKISAIPVPLISPESQKMIDGLMALCDKLEAERNTRSETHTRLIRAVHHPLTEASGAASTATAWRRIRNHFTALYTTRESVQALRQTILQLAVQGKLLAQDLDDEPASIMLDRISHKRDRFAGSNGRKRSKAFQAIHDTDTPFDVPTGWLWTKLGFLAEFINGDRGKNYPNKSEYVDHGVPWINTGHIERNGQLTTSGMNFITEQKFESLRSGKIQEGDLVYCLRGATFGKTAFVSPYSKGAIASSLMIIRPFVTEMNSYIFRYLTSPFGRSQIFRFDNGSAQPNLSAGSVTMYDFPLPPIAEQHRIVAKVDELMALCDRLDAAITARDATASRYAEAVVRQLSAA